MHFSLSVKGPLHNWTPAEWRNGLTWIFRDDGIPYANVYELREAFLAEVAKGHSVVPMSNCPNFDYQKGCQCGRDAPILTAERDHDRAMTEVAPKDLAHEGK